MECEIELEADDREQALFMAKCIRRDRRLPGFTHVSDTYDYSAEEVKEDDE
jgi:hypothetical protein